MRTAVYSVIFPIWATMRPFPLWGMTLGNSGSYLEDEGSRVASIFTMRLVFDMMTSAAARRVWTYHAVGSGRPPRAGAAYPPVTKTVPGPLPGDIPGMSVGPDNAVYLRGLSSGLSYNFSYAFFDFRLPRCLPE